MTGRRTAGGRRRPALAALVAVILLLGDAALAGASAREDALRALADANAETRRQGARALGESGTMADLPALLHALRDPDPLVRALAEGSAWRLWSRSGDEAVDRLLADGIEQMSRGDLDDAIATFTRVIERRPDFAEGWNKRATAYYLAGDFARSLADCHEVIKRNPSHFGALSGYGMIYLQLDQPARALEYFERALAINPNLTQVEETVQALRRHLLQRRRNTI